MGGESFQDFVLFLFRYLEGIQRPSEFRCDLIEFCRRDFKAAVSLLKAERCCPGLGGRELEGPARNFADPQRAHELEAGQPPQVLGVPFPQLRVLGLLADDWVLYDVVAEVVHHRGYCEDAAEPFVQGFFLGVGPTRRRQYGRRAAITASPATISRLVIEAETACSMTRSPLPRATVS